MKKAKKPLPVIEELVAAIERVEPTYSISEHERWVDDEASLAITARIEAIGKKHKQHIGATLSLSLTCSRRFDRDEHTSTGDRPWLMGLSLKKSGCHAGAYLPSDAFWGLRSMIAAGEITHVSMLYEHPNHLVSIGFNPPPAPSDDA